MVVCLWCIPVGEWEGIEGVGVGVGGMATEGRSEQYTIVGRGVWIR